MQKLGYCRVSTAGQDFKDQLAVMSRHGVSPDDIFQEKISGTVSADDRPEFSRMMSRLMDGDELVVAKLDRLGRSTLDILTTINTLRERGVTITIDGTGSIRNDMMGTLTTNLLAAFAEFERAMIYDRMQTGRQRAIAAGVVMGRRPKLSKAAREAIARRYGVTDTGPALAREYGVSIRTIERLAQASKAATQAQAMAA
ncbi:recombinase family protein [Gluconacetobacter tumulicola]|uniref:Recombinase family protein n=1 Tax=Gluconacetobacter tumulicola TaxID=1017177 RepID=A0A7W4JF52_9PROT|nr:recombinase family protein [Gluconacetobacter tumulicola]MBB2180125.1 recombinase family protein [Gluconacetobacter tumulicola]